MLPSIKEILWKLKLRYGSEETAIRTLRSLGMRIGEKNRIYTILVPSEPYLVRIGSNCVIAPGVTFVTHNGNTLLQHKHESLTGFGTVDIKDNCYVGVNVTIMPHVTIGPDSLVAAGSVVTKDVAPRTVVGGNPARHIFDLDEYEKRALTKHIDVPLDRGEMRKVLEKHFWGDEG